MYILQYYTALLPVLWMQYKNHCNWTFLSIVPSTNTTLIQFLPSEYCYKTVMHLANTQTGPYFSLLHLYPHHIPFDNQMPDQKSTFLFSLSLHQSGLSK